MNGRNNKFLIPVAAVVLAASLIGLAISAKQLFFSSNHKAAGSAGGNNTSNAISSSSVNTVNPANANGQATRQAVARNNPVNRRANSPPAYSIFHPPPVVSYPIHGILNSKLSYPVHFVMAMAACPGGQTIAMATEGQGLVMFRPDARPPHRWVQFHPEKAGGGFPSWNTYSVCFDSQGRLWVGTLRKGVVVGFIGRSGWQWRHYDEICRPASAKDPNFPNEGTMTFNGPIGSHVFAITENPVDHSIWLSTEAGISVYYPRGAGKKDADLRGVHKAAGFTGGNNPALQTSTDTPMLFGRWRYITQANGLPSSPVDCIAFDKTGRVFAGTQCNGLAIATMQDNYQHWRIVKGPDHVTIHGTGSGLPSDLINAILVTKRTSKVYVATDWGLGISDDDGQSWHYIRGQDYAARVAQLWHPPKHWKQPSPQSLSRLLPGDHITCLAQDFKGRIYLGTWRNGYAIYQSGKGIIYHNTLSKGAWRHGGDYVNAILPEHLDGQDSEGLGGPTKVVLVARYGPVYNAAGRPVGGKGNPTIAWEGGQNAARRINERQPNTRFPEAAAPPTRDQLASMADQLAEALKHAPSRSPQIVPITDDWRTQGNWLGRYGRYWACLFAAGYPPNTWDDVWSPRSVRLCHTDFIGPHHIGVNTARYWVKKAWTDDNRALEIPNVFLRDRYGGGGQAPAGAQGRTFASADDGGEAYGLAWQGPDFYEFLRLPRGAHEISIYFCNNGGHRGGTRERDYYIKLIPIRRTSSLFWPGRGELQANPDELLLGAIPAASVRFAALQTGTCDARVSNFYGGVWKRFIVQGPMRLVIRISRNYSLNTAPMALMLDTLYQRPTPYYGSATQWNIRKQAIEARGRAAILQLRSRARASALRGPGNFGAVSAVSEALGFVRRNDPTIWVGDGTKVGIAILRWAFPKWGASPGTSGEPILTQQYYANSLFKRWEAAEIDEGLATSRKIEQAVNRPLAGRLFTSWRHSAGYTILRNAARNTAVDSARRN